MMIDLLNSYFPFNHTKRLNYLWLNNSCEYSSFRVNYTDVYDYNMLTVEDWITQRLV